MNNDNVKKLSMNNYLKFENRTLQGKINELEKKLEVFENTSINFSLVEDYYHLKRKKLEINLKFKDCEDNKTMIDKASDLLNSLLSTDNNFVSSLENFVKNHSKEEFFSICSYLTTFFLEKKDEVKNDNIDLLEKIVYLASLNN